MTSKAYLTDCEDKSIPQHECPFRPSLSSSTIVPLVATIVFSIPAFGQEAERMKLLSEVEKVTLNASLIAAYEAFAVSEARKECDSPVPSAFWDDLQGDKDLLRVAAWAWARYPKASFVMRLSRLWEKHPRLVARHPDLAAAFSIAWSSGTHEKPARAWASWERGRSAIPTMCESFEWYAKRADSLRFSITDVSWPLLVYTALNDVPIDERRWVLDRYEKSSMEELHNCFAEVPYLGEGLDGKAETLPNMIKHGGVCTVNTQYGMSVMRTLGFPATFAEGPGHCWPCWVERSKVGLEFRRVNELGNADGTLGQWSTGHERWESDLRLLARAMQHSPVGCFEADVVSAIAAMPELTNSESAGRLLIEGLKLNPYNASTWRALGRSAGSGALPTQLATTWAERLPKSLGDTLGLAVDVLASFLPEGTEKTNSRAIKIARVVARVAETLAASGWEKGRADLGIEAELIHSRALQLADRLKAAEKALSSLSQRALAHSSVSQFRRVLDETLAVLEAGEILSKADDTKFLQRLLAMADADSQRADHARVIMQELYQRLHVSDPAVADQVKREFLFRGRKPTTPTFGSDGIYKTYAAGGSGGGEFLDLAPEGAAVCGVRYSVGLWNGISVIGSIQPLFRRAGEEFAGEVHGIMGDDVKVVMAEPGFVVAGIVVKSGNMVDGFAIFFAPLERLGHALERGYFSPWQGQRGGGDEVLLGGYVQPVIGLHGRQGAQLDAIGLVVSERGR